MLKHADHPKEEVTHQRPYLTNIKLAIQEGLPVPHYLPQMSTLKETQNAKQPEAENINITRMGVEPAPAVQPANNDDTRGEGKSLISLPEVFTGDQSKADNFMQDFKLCWRLNRHHPTMKVPYDRVMLALSYMRGNTVIRNWVKHAMNDIDALVSPVRFAPIPLMSEHLWGEFQTEFKLAFTNTTKVQDAEAALKHICIQQGEGIDQYIICFKYLMQKANWMERDCSTINTFWHGLHEPMQKAIFLKDPIPTTFTQWKEAAHKEASRYVLIKSTGMFQK